MAQTIQLKRSATAGNTPTTSQLALGELGINTADGKLFLKKSVSGTESVVDVGGLPLSGGTLTGNLSLGDNVKAQFGASNDLQLYHNGSYSVIKEAGLGDLEIQTNGSEIQLTGNAGTDYMLRAISNGAVKLYYDNAPKLATTSSGISVTGSVVADGLTVDGDVTATGDEIILNSSTQAFLKLDKGSSSNYALTRYYTAGTEDWRTGTFNDGTSYVIGTPTTKKLSIATNGDISFYDGSGNQALFWDSSTSRLGLGTTVPNDPLHVQFSNNTGADTGIIIKNTNTGTTSNFAGVSTQAVNGSVLGTFSSADYDAWGVGTFVGSQSNHPTYLIANNAVKMTINADGSSVFSGSVTSTGLTVENSLSGATNLFNFQNTSNTANSNSRLKISTGGTSGGDPILQLTDNASNWYVFGDQSDSFKFKIGTSVTDNKFVIDNGGDISFYEDTGTTPKFVWSSANETIAIGTGASSTATISAYSKTVSSNLPSALRIIENTGASSYWDIGANNGSSPNLNFYANANTTPRVTFASSGKVGIGTSSPSSKLDVQQATAGNIISAEFDNTDYTANNRNAIKIRQATSAGSSYSAYLGADKNTGNLFLSNDSITANHLVINSSGKVGIGTTSPSEPLTILSAQDFQITAAYNATNSTSYGYYGIKNNNTGNPFYFHVGGAERMRIDSSGHVLMGKTGAGTNTAGAQVDSTGRGNFTVGANFGLLVNRLTSDGELARFQKDGTTVGSIGARQGDLIVGTGDTGVQFYDVGDAIFPINVSTGGNRDAAIDLGESSNRFKDLYLSGNATAQKLTLTKAPVGTYTIEVDGTNTGQPNLIVKQSTSERFRCDNNGNLLVGKSVTSSSTAGMLIGSNGRFDAVRDGGYVGYFNRLSSDGDIAVFAKDDTIVGSIGTNSGLFISSTYGTDSGIRFASSIIAPSTTTGANRDAAIDLGYSSSRFKDLYLSGKVTAANIYNAAGGHVIDLNNTDSTIINDPDNHSCLLLSGGDYDTNYYSNDTHYFRGRDVLDIHAIIDTSGIKSLGDYKVGGTTVIDASRNITAGTISSGAITSTGALTLSVDATDALNFSANSTNDARGISFDGRTALSADSNDGWLRLNNQSEFTSGVYTPLHLRVDGGVNVQGGSLQMGTTTVIDASRAITNCTGISLTGGSISSYGSVTAGLGSFLVGTRGKMGQVSSDLFVCSTTASHSGLRFANGAIHPTDNTGAQSDSAQIDLGAGSYRFNDIYARNSTILTSDRNEKQDIEELSDAEQRVAVRAKGLIRKFKWKDAVAEKGDDARIHFGIVAQDLQAAFVAEGLDAGDYGVFISNTWTNEDGEEQTRMGVRYGELLAFIISAI